MVVAALISSSTQAAAPDKLVRNSERWKLHSFPYGERRWVEFHWYFDQAAIWLWGCRHSNDNVATTTCDWLMHNTNQEFAMSLPHRIMACHGYGLPKYAHYDWKNVAGTIQLRGASNRRILMDLNYPDLPHGEEAVRVSVADADQVYEPDELPPIPPMPKADAASTH